MLIVLTFSFFPCSDSDSPCPCKVVYKSSEVFLNYRNITYDDLFAEKTKTNYPLIISARKKFEKKLLEKIYYVTYNSLPSYSSFKKFAIYILNDSIKSNNKNLLVEQLPNNNIKYTEIYKGDTISFLGTSNGFTRLKNEYNGYNDNGYGYITWTKTLPNYEVQIRKEVQTDIYENHLFYKFLYWIM